MVRIALDPSNKRFDIRRVLLDFLVGHLLQAPLSELGDGIAAQLAQTRVVLVLRALYKRIKQRFYLWVLVNFA